MPSFQVTWSKEVEASSVEEAAFLAYKAQRQQNAATAKFLIVAEDRIFEDVTLSQTAPLDLLTDREAEVARLVALGASNADIGRELEITPRTVKSHVSNIFDKFYVKNRVQLASKMLRMSIEVE